MVWTGGDWGRWGHNALECHLIWLLCRSGSLDRCHLLKFPAEPAALR